MNNKPPDKKKVLSIIIISVALLVCILVVAFGIIKATKKNSEEISEQPSEIQEIEKPTPAPEEIEKASASLSIKTNEENNIELYLELSEPSAIAGMELYFEISEKLKGLSLESAEHFDVIYDKMIDSVYWELSLVRGPEIAQTPLEGEIKIGTITYDQSTSGSIKLLKGETKNSEVITLGIEDILKTDDKIINIGK